MHTRSIERQLPQLKRKTGIDSCPTPGRMKESYRRLNIAVALNLSYCAHACVYRTPQNQAKPKNILGPSTASVPGIWAYRYLHVSGHLGLPSRASPASPLPLAQSYTADGIARTSSCCAEGCRTQPEGCRKTKGNASSSSSSSSIGSGGTENIHERHRAAAVQRESANRPTAGGGRRKESKRHGLTRRTK